LKTGSDNKTGVYVTKINDGDFIKVRSIDFGKGVKQFEASVASASNGGKIEIHVDGKEGILIGTLDITSTGGDHIWQTLSCKVAKMRGIHDVYFVFKGSEGNLFNFDWWKFQK